VYAYLVSTHGQIVSLTVAYAITGPPVTPNWIHDTGGTLNAPMKWKCSGHSKPLASNPATVGLWQICQRDLTGDLRAAWERTPTGAVRGAYEEKSEAGWSREVARDCEIVTNTNIDLTQI